MGGAIGNVVGFGTGVLSTAASLLADDSAERRYYRSMAKRAEEQARQIEETAQRNVAYMMEQAGYENQQLGQEYSSLVGSQKSTLAANGLNSQSATVQLILKNSRLNAQLDQEMLSQNLNRSIYETTTSAQWEADQQRQQAKQYRRASKNKVGLWSKIGATVSSFLEGR